MDRRRLLKETAICINLDHPLSKRASAKIETNTLYLARLITQDVERSYTFRRPVYEK